MTPTPMRSRIVRIAGGASLASLSISCQPSAPAPSRTARLPVVATDWAGTRPVALASAKPPPVAPKGTWVLHVGDSFTDASFQQNLRPHFDAAGVRYVAKGKTATFTTTWAHDKELDSWLSRRPSLVLVTLGANEVDDPIPRLHAYAVETIVRKISAASPSCVWITPPMWKDETGILRVIHDHCAPCLFFDSDALLGGLTRDERQPDRIHPNDRGGLRWANAFWTWLEDHRDATRGPWGLVPFERRDAGL